MVPVLYGFFPHISPQTVIGTSLAAIFINGIVNIRNFKRVGLFIDRRFFMVTPPFLLLGVWSGVQLSFYLSGHLLKYIFAALLVVVAIKNIITKANVTGKADWQLQINGPNTLKLGFICVLSGMISSLTGTGGGVVLIPLFISVMKIPLRRVSAYSNAAMITTCGMGMGIFMMEKTSELLPFGYGQIGHVNLGIAMCFCLGSFFSSRLGVKWSQQLGPRVIRILFIALLLLLALKMLITA